MRLIPGTIYCKESSGFSLTELMVVLVIIGVLVLLALPKLLPLVTKAKTTEAKLALKQLYTLEQTHRFEIDRYTKNLQELGYEENKLISDGGQARYTVKVSEATADSFYAEAVSVVDFDGDGTFNVWAVDQTGSIREKTPD
jgi:type IV pilus assembly protein PilE